MSKDSSLNQYKNRQQSLAIVYGNFFAIHPGHIRLLKYAKECADIVLVAITNNNNIKDVPTPEERIETLKNLSLVDDAIVLNQDINSLIEELKPEFLVKGSEHRNTPNPEQSLLEQHGGKLVFASGDANYSGSDLFIKLSQKTLHIDKPEDFLQRHQIKASHLKKSFANFSNLKLLVIGDLIIDEYINCEPLGMSREDPTIVVSPVASQKFCGGAGIVANHAANLGAHVTFISVAGKDDSLSFAKNKLDEYGVNHLIYTDDSRPTTLKQRFRSNNKTLFRVSHLRQHNIDLEIQEQILDYIKTNIKQFDAIIFSDFNYGVLTDFLISNIAKHAVKHNVFTAADSQSSSQLGDISRYKNINLICPTEHEARISLRDQQSSLSIIAQNLKNTCNCENLLVTLGAAGVMIEMGATRDIVPALNASPIDVSGAGDSMLITTSLGLCSGLNIWEATYLGSLAAAVQTSRVGNIPISKDELLTELNH